MLHFVLFHSLYYFIQLNLFIVIFHFTIIRTRRKSQNASNIFIRWNECLSSYEMKSYQCKNPKLPTALFVSLMAARGRLAIWRPWYQRRSTSHVLRVAVRQEVQLVPVGPGNRSRLDILREKSKMATDMYIWSAVHSGREPTRF